jgi:hypothetical protein
MILLLITSAHLLLSSSCAVYEHLVLIVNTFRQMKI